MRQELRKMPIGIQDFEKLRTGNNLYVDKTMYIEKLLSTDAPYFLGRPRRFGKSLFLSTLKYYFQGRKELFEDLYISTVEEGWVEYPVFYIDFNEEGFTDIHSLYQALDTNLKRMESLWGKDETETTPASRLSGLIRRAYEKSGHRVVILVDEYDKPLVNTMDNEELNKNIRAVLKGFYGILKSADVYLRFVFLTGVTKFSKVSVFSDLNHLNDISMDNEFSGICGISERELLRDFQPEIQTLAKKQQLTYNQTVATLKKHYDGYRFAKESEDMYNPFSMLNAFSKKDFGYYWFQTGTPTFLAKMLKNIDFNLPDLESDVTVAANYVTDYRAENQDPVPVLYQSGYLTIKSYDRETDTYKIGFPNEEVKYGFLRELTPAYSHKNINDNFLSVLSMMQALKRGDADEMMRCLQSFYASIPYDLTEKQHKNERYFQMLFYLVFALMGQYVQTEVKSAKGRADAVVKTQDTVFVFEFKMDKNATVEAALQQIEDKGYLIPYQTEGKNLVKIGAVFNGEVGGLMKWRIV